MKTVISKDGTKIAYDQVGQGPVLIVVNGASVIRRHPLILKTVDLLSKEFTVINYDRRARGDSGDTKPYAVERELEDLQALIDATGGGPVYLYGASSGAVLCMRAINSGLKVKKMALWEPPFVVNDTDRRAPADSFEQLTKMIDEGRKADAITFFTTQVFGMPKIMPWIMRVTPYWKLSMDAANSLPYDMAVMGDWALPKFAASIKVPTIVMGGEKSQPLLRHSVDAVAKTIPGAKLVNFPGQGHAVSAKIIAPELTMFFKG